MLPISADFIEGIDRAALAGDDVFGGLAPDEGFRHFVVVCQIIMDRDLEFIDAGIAAASDAPRRDLGEEAFDGACQSNLA